MAMIESAAPSAPQVQRHGSIFDCRRRFIQNKSLGLWFFECLLLQGG